METEQLAALSEHSPSEELTSRFPSFELDFSHEQLEQLEECSRGVVFYGGEGPSSAAGPAADRGPQAERGSPAQPSGPLYQREYQSASVLVCNIPVRSHAQHTLNRTSHPVAHSRESSRASRTAHHEHTQ